MMRIIVLTGAYYPQMSPVANCIDKHICELLKKGYTIDLICPSSDIGFKPLEIPNLHLHYITNWWNSLRLYCYFNIRRGENLWFWKVILFLVRLYGVIISPYTFPTRHSWMKKKYRNSLLKLHPDRVDAIISVSDPPCAHIAVLSIKKLYPKIKWITYTLDPYTYNPAIYKDVFFRSIRRKRNFEQEVEIYNNSDCNIFTEELYHLALDKFNQKKEKTMCFPYVLSEDLPNSKRSNTLDGKITFIYAGALRKAVRNPETLLKIISNIPEYTLKMYIAGDWGDIIKKYKTPNIEIYDIVNRKEYLRLITSEADVLVNLANSNSLQAPSKFLELISTGLPVINVFYKRDSCYYMTESYPLGLNISQTESDGEVKLKDFCQKTKGKRMPIEEVKKLFPHNIIANQVNDLLQMIGE